MTRAAPFGWVGVGGVCDSCARANKFVPNIIAIAANKIAASLFSGMILPGVDQNKYSSRNLRLLYCEFYK